MMFAVVDRHAAQIEQKCFSCCLHTCIILVTKWDVWGNSQVNVREKKKRRMLMGPAHNDCCQLNNRNRTNKHSAPSLCLSPHTQKLYHTFKHTTLNSATLFSHCHRQAHITGIGLYSCDTGVCVFPKTLMLCFLSAKSKVFRELGVSLKIPTSLRCLPPPSFPPPSRPAG